MARKPKIKGSRYWSAKCEPLWKKIIKAGGKCEICEATKYTAQMHAHHLISCKIPVFKWDVNNGLCLCSRCHKLDPECSAHASTASAANFNEKLKQKLPHVWEWIEDNRHKKWQGIKVDYEQVYYELRDILAEF